MDVALNHGGSCADFAAIHCGLDQGGFGNKRYNMKVGEAFHSLCTALVGKSINHVWRGHGSAVFLEAGELTPTVKRDGTAGNPEGEIGVGVEWSWRIEANRSIICGSWSEEHLWQPAFERLDGELITNVELFGALMELIIEVGSGARFLSFSTTEGQPQWSVIDRRELVTKSFYVDKGNLCVDSRAAK